MSVCTFFGHHDCPDEIRPRLKETLTDLIENHSVKQFAAMAERQRKTVIRLL